MQLYEEYPEIYDKLYADMKDYQWEAEQIEDALPDRAETMLSLGCGTGLHDAHFASAYEVTGVDLTQGMLDVAKQRNPTVSYKQGDIKTVSLDEEFDVALCLFTVINYLEGVEELVASIRNIASHLKQGGVLVIDYRDVVNGFDSGVLPIDTYEEEGLRVTRTGVSRLPATDKLDIEFHITVAEGETITSFSDEHELTNFSSSEYNEAFEKAGLTFNYEGSADFPLLVGTKR